MMRHLFALVVIALGSVCALGQPLADRVPADAIVYVGWQGSEAMPPAYAESHLKCVVDASNFGRLAKDLLTRIADAHTKTEDEADHIIQIVKIFCLPLWRHPTAIYFSGIDLKDEKGLRAKGALLCQAGAEGDPLLGQFRALALLSFGQPYPMRAFKNGNLVVLAMGYDRDEDVLAGGSAAAAPAALVKSPKFQEAWTHVKGDAVVAAYVDGEAGVAFVDQVVALSSSPAEIATWKKNRPESGWDSLRRLALAAGFDGKEWSTRMFIGATAPRKGMLSLLDGQPVSDQSLRLIPPSAISAGVERLDLAALFDFARESSGQTGTIGQVDLNSQRRFDSYVASYSRMFGFDVRNDLLAALGDEWTFYANPPPAPATPAAAAAALAAAANNEENDETGVVLINRLKNPIEAERVLEHFHRLPDPRLTDKLKLFGITFEKKKLGELTIHTVRMGFQGISPSAVIKDGRLYVTPYQKTLLETIQRPAQAQSILDNAGFIALRTKLPQQNVQSLSFADLPKTAAPFYPQFRQMLGFAFAAADLGGRSPAEALPPIESLTQHLGSTAGFTWTDDAGWHYKGTSPFPGSSLLSPNGHLTFAMSALSASVLLPGLDAGGERANRIRCASGLRQIGAACLRYAKDHNGQYPQSLAPLVKDLGLSPDVFLCPSGGTKFPDSVRKSPLDQQATWVASYGDFSYRGNLISPSFPADTILAYEKTDDHAKAGMNVLFNDGRVQWMVCTTAMELVRKPLGVAPRPPAAPPAGRTPPSSTPPAATTPPAPTPANKPAPVAAEKKPLDTSAAAQGKLSLADSYMMAGAKENAKATYETILKDYPNTPAAAEAKKRMEQIK